MNRLNRLLRRLLLSSCLALPLAAQAAPTTFFVPDAGAGNLSVFDAMAGTGGWVGSIDAVAPPLVSDPLSLVSFVLFTLDAGTLALNGRFEFTTVDLQSTLFGDVSGTADSADFLTLGGQLSLDYSIRGGSGAYTDASGFGLAFLCFDPAGGFNNYSEIGLLDFSVPEPATLALLAAGLLGVGLSRRQARSLNSRPPCSL